jgi:hypothetical protein
MGSLSVKNASEKFSRLGTFKELVVYVYYILNLPPLSFILLATPHTHFEKSQILKMRGLLWDT